MFVYDKVSKGQHVPIKKGQLSEWYSQKKEVFAALPWGI